MSQQGGVHFVQGSGDLVVPNGSKLTVEVGGTLQIDGNGSLTAVEFDTDYFTVSEGAVTLKASVVALLEIIENIPTVDPADDGETIWLDGNGVLKVSGPSGG